MKAVLGLEDGDSVIGEGFGVEGSCAGELVFCTTMTGYMEALTDPSYNGQILMFTYPLIGNYGVDEENFQSDGVKALGCVVREICRAPSGGSPLDRFFERNGLLGITGVDTRRLTIKCREMGTMRAALILGDDSREHAVECARNVPLITDVDLIAAVSCREPYRIPGPGKRVAVLDLGIKRNQLVSMSNRGLTSMSSPTTPRTTSWRPAGPMPSSSATGPGTPRGPSHPIECVRSFIGEIPIFGICFGNQITGLALGADTYKLKFGHRGTNQPVRYADGSIYITTQNHGFVVDGETLPEGCDRLPHECERRDPRGLRGQGPRHLLRPVPPRGPRGAPRHRGALLRQDVPEDPLMPRKEHIKKVLLIGSGPIQIGQAAEFDFSGSQACRALREEGVTVVLVNSNPATIQTDPEMADIIYIEPLRAATIAKIIEKERPDGILSGMGGQTGLNMTAELAEMGALAGGGDPRDPPRGDLPGGGPGAVQEPHGGHRRAGPAFHDPPELSRDRRGRADGRPSRDHPPRLYPGRERRRGRTHPGGAPEDHGGRPHPVPYPPGPHRGERARVEGDRVRGDAGRCRYLHHRLRDGERGRDGHPYRARASSWPRSSPSGTTSSRCSGPRPSRSSGPSGSRAGATSSSHSATGITGSSR